MAAAPRGDASPRPSGADFQSAYDPTMVGNRTDLTPPDDSGTDAFTRFRYQAHVAFRFCLRCYFDQGVTAVVAEHFEDVSTEAGGAPKIEQ